MSDTIIQIQGIAKRYIIGHQAQKGDGLRHALERLLRSPWQALKSRRQQTAATREEFWALSDVSAEVKVGEIVGFIGRNGAGKSTLLKLLSRITEPTRGRIRLRGRVASLLEVGTGFHPELTGRENIFLNGAILGMSRAEIKGKFDQIVEFSEVEKFLDTPVKRYSSGMYVRLAFSIAAHLDPDILIVDEVLAVGDSRFQEKCLGKMKEANSSQGRTVLFVSHNVGVLSSLCRRCILLERGRVAMDGAPKEVIPHYLQFDGQSSGERLWPDLGSAPGSESVRLRAVRMLSREAVSPVVSIDEPITIEIECQTLRPNLDLSFGITLFNEMGIEVLGSGNFPSASLSPDPTFGKPFSQGVFRARCTLPANLLNDGVYVVDVHVATRMTLSEISLHKAITFRATDTGGMRAEWTQEWTGVIRPKLGWQTRKVEP